MGWKKSCASINVLLLLFIGLFIVETSVILFDLVVTNLALDVRFLFLTGTTLGGNTSIFLPKV